MGTGTRERSFSGKLVSLAATLALVLAASGLCASDVLAADLSVQGTTPAAQTPSAPIGGDVLAQTNTLAQSSTENWLTNFHISGFLNQRAGMWTNPTTLKDFTPSRNNLAILRTWLQADMNYRLGSSNQFFLRTWFVYEPPVSFNSANNGVFTCFDGALACGNGSHYSMYRLNGFYNQYTVRDAWWKLNTGPLTLYLGNQIVVWGQSLAFRVGDQINPQDTTWAFGFANLEQSRVPQWMVHPILNLPDLGPLNSNFLEGVLIPGAQPIWNSDEYPDARFDGQTNSAGRVSVGFPAAEHGPSAVFDVHYDNTWTPGRNVILAPLGPNGPFGPQGNGLVASPFSREFMYCSQLAPALSPVPGNNPIPVNQRRPCDLTGSVMAGNTRFTGPVTIGPYRVPAVTLGNMEEGLRLHTLWGPNEITLLYFNTFQYEPIFRWTQFTNIWNATYEPTQYAGATIDRPVWVPQSLSEYLPLVGRAEITYDNHAPFINEDPRTLGGVRYADQVLWMAALDVDQAYAPWLTSTGNLTANLEVFDQMVPDTSGTTQTGPNGADVSQGGSIQQRNTFAVLGNLATSWWWNAFAPNLTGIYSPTGNSIAMFPGIQFNPPWTNKYFARIDYIQVFGTNRENSFGFFKGENMILLSGQYNWSLL